MPVESKQARRTKYLGRSKLINVVSGVVLLLASVHLIVDPGKTFAATVNIGSADVHFYVGTISVNLQISQSENNCGVPLNGQTCLRYTVYNDDTGDSIASGYGLIPSTAIQVTMSRITLSVNTSTIANFTNLTGLGGVISVTWQASSSMKTVVIGSTQWVQSSATAQGNIFGLSIPNSGIDATMLLYDPPGSFDTIAPTTIVTVLPAPNQGGWNNTAVTVQLTATDDFGGSGVAATYYSLDSTDCGLDSVSSCSVYDGPFSVNEEGKHTLTFFSEDNSGNAEAVQQVPIQIDMTPPRVIGTPSRAADHNGWYNAPFTITWSGGTDMSGIAGCDADVLFTGPDSATASASGHCTDGAGNVGSGNFGPFQYDATAPRLNISGAENLTSFNVCSPVARPSFAPSDDLSGLDGSQADSWVTPITESGAGTYVYSAHAMDNAGNSSNETRTYTMVYGDAAARGAFGGYLAPINEDGTSQFQLGRTIPVKFQLLCNGVPITNAVAKLTVKQADGTSIPGTGVPTSTDASAPSNLFRYDSTSQQYIFNLSTKSAYANPGGNTNAFVPGTWTISILLDDGTYRSVNIRLTS